MSGPVCGLRCAPAPGRLSTSYLSRLAPSATAYKPYDCGKTHPGLRPSLGFCLRSRLIRLLPGAQRFLLVTLRSPPGRVAFPPSRAGLLAALRPLARPRFGPGSPARRLSASYLSRLAPSATAYKPYDCGKTHPGLRPSLGFCLRSRLIRLLPGAQRFLLVTLRSPPGRVAFPPSRAGLLAALRPLARPRFGPGSPARRLSASYLMSLLVLPARNWDTSAVLFSSLYRPGTAAYRAAQVTRSCFQVISLGAWAWLSAPGPKPTQGMP